MNQMITETQEATEAQKTQAIRLEDLSGFQLPIVKVGGRPELVIGITASDGEVTRLETASRNKDGIIIIQDYYGLNTHSEEGVLRQSNSAVLAPGQLPSSYSESGHSRGFTFYDNKLKSRGL